MGDSALLRRRTGSITSYSPIEGDRCSGSRERYLIEFGIPEDYEHYVESDFRRLKQIVEVEMETEDLSAWDELCKLKGFANLCTKTKLELAESTEGKDPKKDPEEITETPGQVLAHKIERLKAGVRETLMKFQEQCTTLKVVRTRAESNKEKDMIGNFLKALGAQIGRTQRLVTMLDKMMTQAMEDKMIPKLLELMESVDERFENMMKWAVSFACDGGESGKRGKKRGRKEESLSSDF